jgi:hypothetical protein
LEDPVKFGIAVALASLFSLTGLNAVAGSLTLPSFHDGIAAPKTIAVVVARPHRVAANLISVR